MVFNIILSLLLIALLFYDFKKGVIIIALFSVTLNFFNFPLKALQTVYLVSAFFAVLIGFYHYQLRIVKHPLFWCVLLPLISLNATMVYYGKFSLGYNFNAIVQYVFPVVLYYSIRKKSDITFYLKCMTGYLVVIVLYCFMEEIIQYNPVMAWCSQYSENFQWMTSRIKDVSFRFGFKRAQSLFSGEAAFAAVCIYYLFIILFLRIEDSKKIKWIHNALIFTIPICILFTGTRSAILALTISLIGFVSFKSFKRNYLIIGLGIIGVLVAMPYLTQIINSIIDSNKATIGSSEDMRIGQWEIAFYYLSQNSIIGNGIGFTGALLRGNEEGLFGAEGMWLPILMDRGFIGFISVLSAYVLTILILIRKKMYAIIWVVISFLVFKTITTVVGVGEGYYLLIVVFLMRYKEMEDGKIKNNKVLKWEKYQLLYRFIK